MAVTSEYLMNGLRLEKVDSSFFFGGESSGRWLNKRETLNERKRSSFFSSFDLTIGTRDVLCTVLEGCRRGVMQERFGVIHSHGKRVLLISLYRDPKPHSLCTKDIFGVVELHFISMNAPESAM